MKHNKIAWAGLIVTLVIAVFVHFWPLWLGISFFLNPPVLIDSSFFPENAEVETDFSLGWPGTGADVIVANIPLEDSEEFAQKLLERGFAEIPITETVPRQDFLAELDAPLAVTNGLWLIDKEPEDPYDYVSCTLYVYDFDTCTYYSVTYDY